MKVNINIDEKILGKIDEIARREKRSRSQTIQLLLKDTLGYRQPDRPGSATTGKYDRFFGCWEGRESAEELIREVRRSLEKNLKS